MRRINKEAVLADAKKGIREYKEHQKSLFNQRYNKTEEFKFPGASEIDMNRFFFFPKFDEEFCMSLPSIAIYPVLCLQSDFKQNNWFQLSQKNIAKLAGIDVNTVVKGIKDLEKKTLGGEPFLETQKQTEGMRHFYIYRVNYYRKDHMKKYEYDFITFHKCIVDSGVWAALKPRAKALYLSIRMSAKFDPYLYEEIEDIGLEPDSSEFWELMSGENYRNRKWDVSNTTLTKLCRNVDIKPINLKPVIEQLEVYHMIERVDENKTIFKVYLKPRI